MSQFKSFEYAIIIAETGGFSQAAERLGISQPTLSKYIKKLESDIGLELFDRSAVPLRITEAGERYIAFGKRFVDLAGQLEKTLSEIKSSKNSLIRVGISPSRSPYMIPQVIEAYTQIHPEGKAVITEKTTKELSELLRDGALDVIISLSDSDTEGFEKREIYREKIMVAAPKDSSQTKDALKLMQSMPIISVGKGQSLYRTLSLISDRIGAPTPKIECQSIESGLSLVKRGLGVMLVPSYIEAFGSAEQLSKIDFLPLPREISEDLTRTVCIFYKKEQFLTLAERDFISCIINTVKE